MAVAGKHEAKRDIPMLTREASVLPNTLDDDARTIEVVWTTGAPVLRGWMDQYYEELSLDPKDVRLGRLNNGAPFLNSHDGYDANGAIGVVVAKSASVDGKRGVATIRFAKAEDDPDADQIFRKIKDGIIQNISVGYMTYTLEETDESIDGIPVYRATDWEPYELSAVAMGADDGAGFRSQDPKERRTSCLFVTRSATATPPKDKKMADEDENKTPTNESPAVAATRAARAERIADAKLRAEDRAEAAEEARLAERERATGIRSIAKRTKLGEEWAANMIEKGVSVDKAREVAFDDIVENDEEFQIDGTVRIGAGDDARDKFIRGASAWMFERTSTKKLIENAAKKSPDSFKGVSFDGGEFRGYSPLELARLSLERQGVKTRGMDKMALLGLAFTHRSGSSYQTTSDFATMLENVMGKVLLGAYATQETTYDLICGVEELPDFRQSNRYRTGSVDSLDAVAEHGEYKNGVIPDAAKYGISTERKGKIFALSREALINDDMGALTNLATEFGRASGRTLENGFYALLAANGGLGPTMGDGNPYFHASRANVGVGSALTVLGVDGDRVVMRAQKDPANKDYLTITPKILLVPDSLYGTARVINDSSKDPDANNKLERKNIAFGMFDPIIGTPRLASNSTRRYIFGDPALAAAFVTAYLEGYGRGPLLESQNGWRTDGVEWRVTLYAKVQPADPKAALTNAGA